MKTLLVLVAVLWAGTGWAENCWVNTGDYAGPCGGPGDPGIRVSEEASMLYVNALPFLLTDKETVLAMVREAGARGELLMLGEVGPDDNVRPIHFQFDAEGRLKESPCLERMEAAMRAMEPWLFDHAPFTKTSDFQRDKALFLEVKRECWQHEGGKP